MSGFIFFILNGLFSLIIWMLIISAVLSWLIAFNIINMNNRGMYQVVETLNRFTNPILEPFRRLIPPMGGLDLSFIVAYLVITGMQRFLFPIAQASLAQVIG